MVRLPSIFGGASAYDGYAKKYAGDRIFRKKFSPLGLEKFNQSPGFNPEKNYPILSVQYRL
jgi:hypothetical protein